MVSTPDTPEVRRLEARREFLKKAAAGTALVALGGAVWRIAGDDLTREARAQRRPDGRQRLPPGQKVIQRLRPMGGQPGSPRVEDFRLRVHGEVDRPFTLTWSDLLALPQLERAADVHCVTGWSVLGGVWTGVEVRRLAALAGVRERARHVIFESAHGYTANVPLAAAMDPSVMVVHQLDRRPLGRRYGAPVRSLVPDLYFWKSAKWLTGIRFVRRDEPGYWEVRGYHNHGDPWLEERHA